MGSPQGRERRLRRGSAARPDPAAPRTSDAIGSRVRRGRPISGAAAPQRPATLPAGPSPHGGSWLPSARGAPVADRGEERRAPARAEERGGGASLTRLPGPAPAPAPALPAGGRPPSGEKRRLRVMAGPGSHGGCVPGRGAGPFCGWGRARGRLRRHLRMRARAAAASAGAAVRRGAGGGRGSARSEGEIR